ncbi:hypothetical protein LEL_09276 [Akanthomyces lecanii RCEF 1005]|uniref:Azaphilone pigments biosynthesis cluster protein L N-terminal domain-containing protein n=1 Tax=Akanthomyces lecanii RCEF 1005 TaxID=1081108 RepID=A0A168D0Z9_CORDF|nr:hypothetical protein LEL_09276 [Akanthomyces lecanii RCEF 1005]
MAEAIGIAAGALAFASFAYNSVKSLVDFIEALNHAKLQDVRQDLRVLAGIIRSLQADLERADGRRDLSANQKESLTHIKNALEGCKMRCDDFSQHLRQILSSSAGAVENENLSKVDRLRLHFNEGVIKLFRSNLQDCKLTLSIALQHLQLRKSTDGGSDGSLRQLNDTVARFVSEATGQFEGLQKAIDVISATSANISRTDVDAVVSSLNAQANMLKQCLLVCEGALKDTTTASVNVRNNQLLNKARMIVADAGGGRSAGLSMQVEGSIAKDESRIFVITGATDMAALSQLSDPK